MTQMAMTNSSKMLAISISGIEKVSPFHFSNIINYSLGQISIPWSNKANPLAGLELEYAQPAHVFPKAQNLCNRPLVPLSWNATNSKNFRLKFTLLIYFQNHFHFGHIEVWNISQFRTQNRIHWAKNRTQHKILFW